MFNRDKTAIKYYQKYGPIFGNVKGYYDFDYDIIFEEDLFKGWINAGENSDFFKIEELELLQEKGRRGNFDTQEIEIFKVIYE